MDTRNEFLATIDGFSSPNRLRGWAARWQDDLLDPNLTIAVFRDDDVIATAVLSIPRPDVTGSDEVPAGFSLICETFTLLELMNGTIQVRAVDVSGAIALVSIWAPIEDEIRQELSSGEAQVANLIIEAEAASQPAEDHDSFPPSGHSRNARSKRESGSGPKIVLIGAGSTVFAKNIIGDILLYPELRTSHICLYDIDEERLFTSGKVADRIKQAIGCDATIETTSDLGYALDDAKYAITMLQVGGYRPATVTDFSIPKRFGVRQTIGDTVGIGGIMRGLRTIPVMIDIVTEMERRCPGVVHLNYANPMAMICGALSRASSIRTIGLCHSVPHTAAELARDIGVPFESINYLVAGINHMAFFLKLEAHGKDLYPELLRVARERRVPPHNRVRYDLLQRFGYFVTESSEHFAEYVPWYIKRGREDLIKKFNIPLDEYPRRCEAQIAEWQTLANALLNDNASFDTRLSNEYAATIIHSMETGIVSEIYGNVPNSGLISNLPSECCVEVPCIVDENGVRAVAVGTIPPQLAALMLTNINVQTLVAEAVLTGRREHVYHAAMLDPHTAAELDLDQIYELVDAMLDAHRAWLPKRFF